MDPSVLIVDDSLTVRMDLKSAFDSASYACTLAASVAEARSALARGNFDLAVLDVLLPDGDGVGLLSEIRENPATAALPVIMLSIEADVHSRLKALKTGAQEYVGKPYVAEYLLSRANQLIKPRGDGAVSAERPVLVIDDSATYRQRFKEMVEPRGYRVLQASSGEEGLRLAAEARPMAIIVDGVMPGLDGLTVVRRLRSDEVLRQVPLLFVTGVEDKSFELKALEAGADAFMRKDEDSALMLARLEALLRPGGASGEHGGEASLFGAKRLLAITCDHQYADSLQEHMLREGCEIAVASDVNEALELLQVQSVDCIFIEADIASREVLTRIREKCERRSIPVILLAHDPGAIALREAFDAGADDFVLKSSEFPVTIARIRNRLHRKQLDQLNQKVSEERLLFEAREAEAAAMKQLAEFREHSIEQLRRANRELEAARTAALAASHAKTEFLARMSHEIRTPLHGIIGMAELLHRSALAADQRSLLDGVIESGNLLLKIVNDVLDFSKVIAGKIQFERVEFDLVRVLESTLQSFAAQAQDKGIELVLAPARSIPAVVRGDPARVRQVLMNLIGNAVKFTDKGEVVVSVSADGAGVRFEVRDTGIGIAEDRQKRLFQEFFQVSGPRQFGGTGLGLAIAAKLVEAMKGTIGVESAPGSGSTFHFTLPLERVAAAPRPIPSAIAGLRAIVIESNRASREAIAAILESAGVQAATAEPSGALSEIRRAADGQQPYTVAVIANRENARDGPELAAAIAADRSLAAMRVVTTCPFSADTPRIPAQPGVNACITRPVTPSALLDAIAKLIGAGEDGEPHRVVSTRPAAADAMRILVAEDNAINRRLAKMQLENLGYLADVAGDGREAVDAHIAHGYPIILMDCEMPRLDGYAATREIRQRESGGPRTIVIAMTAHAVEDARDKCLAAGMDDYIAKPVTLEVLRRAIERWAPAVRGQSVIHDPG